MRLTRILALAVFATPTFSRTIPSALQQSSAPIAHPSTHNRDAVLNAKEFPGEDIGAQVNAAAATCTRGEICHIVISPSGLIDLTTPIIMVNAEEVECSRSGYVQNHSEGASTTQLSYAGTGVAVTMNGQGDTFSGCNLLLGSSAAGGILMGGYSDHADQITVSGGGTGTTLVDISGRGTEDAHWRIRGLRISLGSA